MYKCILSGAIKFASLRSSQGHLSLFKITRVWVLFLEKFRCNLTYFENENFSYPSFHYIFESDNFRFHFLYGSKIVHERNGHLEIFRCPQEIEDSRQYLLLRADVLQKSVVGCPCGKSRLPGKRRYVCRSRKCWGFIRNYPGWALQRDRFTVKRMLVN